MKNAKYAALIAGALAVTTPALSDDLKDVCEDAANRAIAALAKKESYAEFQIVNVTQATAFLSVWNSMHCKALYSEAERLRDLYRTNFGLKPSR